MDGASPESEQQAAGFRLRNQPDRTVTAAKLEITGKSPLSNFFFFSFFFSNSASHPC
jgi:hypothetical protein